MCCFSRPVNSVSTTRIFARHTRAREQAIVYQMKLDAPEDLAMILPIPVAQPAGDDAVTFVNLEKYDHFFADLSAGFPAPPSRSRGGPQSLSAGSIRPLKVQDVGSFEASFVPNVKSFSRLDARFRLPDAAWDSLPRYADYGFAVFKLKEGKSDLHPMAFKFPTAIPRKLFFPTVHIHDGKVHDRENFDHILYAQAEENALIPKWRESPKQAGEFVDVVKAEGLVQRTRHVYRSTMRGEFENADITVEPRAHGG